jgi:hypothetical protein
MTFNSFQKQPESTKPVYFLISVIRENDISHPVSIQFMCILSPEKETQIPWE